MTVGDRIRELRRERRMSQEDVANAVGACRQLVSYWEHNKNVTSRVIMKLMSAFDVSADEILKNVDCG